MVSGQKDEGGQSGTPKVGVGSDGSGEDASRHDTRAQPAAPAPPAQAAAAQPPVAPDPVGAAAIAPTLSSPIMPTQQTIQNSPSLLKPGSSANGASSQLMKRRDKVKLVISAGVLIGAAAIAFVMRLTGVSSQDAFAMNAAGLIIAQGIAGTVDAQYLKWFPWVATLASLLLLWGSYYVSTK